MDFSATAWDPALLYRDTALVHDPAQFDYDEFLQYDDAAISPEEALPTVEKEGFNTAFQLTPPSAFDLIDESYSRDFEPMLSYQDFQFPVPPSAYSHMPLFNNGYACVPDAMQYRSGACSMTPAHSRQSSHASFMDSNSKDSPSPLLQNEPVTPVESPQIPFLGERPLLPRVRPQDQVVVRASSPKKQPTVPASKRFSAPVGVVRRPQRPKPGHSRSVSFDHLSAHLIGNDPVVQVQPASFDFAASKRARPASTYTSPVARARSEHVRRHSTQVDADSLLRYSRPTYRSTPAYTPASLDMSGPAAVLSFTGAESFPMSRSSSVYEQHNTMEARQESPYPSRDSVVRGLVEYSAPAEQVASSTALSAILTGRNPSPNICSEVDSYQRIDKSSQWWWWDIRQVRQWSSFSLEAMLAHDSVRGALATSISTSALASSPSAGISSPKSLKDLKTTLGAFIMPRLNTALQALSDTTASSSKLTMRFGDGVKEPDFISTSSSASSSAPTAHVVGILRTWTHWNSGMISEREPQRIAYCRGLAELHGRMRDAGTRYGFLLNETELTVVRNGTEPTPDFGHVQIANFALSSFAPPPPTPSAAAGQQAPAKLTALLALLFLHALAAPAGLEGEPRFESRIGAPVELTRAKVLRDARGDEVAKDDWIPEIKAVMDSRPAKNARGWVRPADALSSKEKKRMKGVRYDNYRGEARR